MRLLPLFVFCLAISAVSCTEDDECRKVPQVEPIASIELVHLSPKLAGLEKREDVEAFMDTYPDFHKSYLESEKFPKKFVVENIYRLVNDPKYDSLNRAVMKFFADFSPYEQQLTEGFSRTKAAFPNYSVPKIYTAVTAFGTDLFLQDSLLLISLDYFMDSLKYRPTAYLPNYILRRRTPRHLVPNIFMLISQQFNAVDMQDNTMINEMIKWGKTHYFTSRVLPCVADSLIIGYSAEEISGVEENLNKVWEYYVEEGLFYETEHFKIRKFVEERPNTPEISPDCPGRTGQYLGWKIVEKYAQDRSFSLAEVMALTDAVKVFQESKFKPAN